MQHAQQWIDGRRIDAVGEKIQSYNPATGEVIGTCTEAGPLEVKAAVAAAKEAFSKTNWKVDRYLRSRVLYQMADIFEKISMCWLKWTLLKSENSNNMRASKLAWCLLNCVIGHQ